MGEVTACYLEQPVDLPVPLNHSFHLNPKNEQGTAKEEDLIPDLEW